MIPTIPAELMALIEQGESLTVEFKKSTTDITKDAYENDSFTMEVINVAVAEVIVKLVHNPKFEAGIREKIDAKIDISEMKAELEGLEKQCRQLSGAKAVLKQLNQIALVRDSLPYISLRCCISAFFDL